MIGIGIRLAAGLLLAIVLSQFPEFVQQYRQRLGGAIDALAPIVAHFDQVASKAGLSRTAALDRLRANPDDLVVGQTEATEEVIIRFDSLSRQARGLNAVSGLKRLAVFAREYDPLLARRTYADFRPAVPVTLEGVFHAAGGFVLGYTLAALILGLIRSLLGRSMRMRRTAYRPSPERAAARR